MTNDNTSAALTADGLREIEARNAARTEALDIAMYHMRGKAFTLVQLCAPDAWQVKEGK